MGVNPRRPYDDDYSLFIQLLSRQLATAMASVVLFEQEIRRGQRAARLAALDRIELAKQLDLRTQEAMESETKFTRMAEFAPVGMFIADSKGRITYSNETWWEISHHPRGEDSADTWMESVKDEDREVLNTVWRRLVVQKHAITHEFRFKEPWMDRNGSKGDTWVLMSAYPERDELDDLKSVFGSITNISQQKWAEDFQKRRMEEAVELKRQQENFIDITSHEMRNPLSAILQSADEITTTLSQHRLGEASNGRNLQDALDASVDAAQTIALCAQHQKRIVDDILTLSKLDSALLLVTPVETQPHAVVQRALKMFEGELETNDISMEFQIEESYRELKVDWVKLDPSRLLQVLINLTTNAIKFTHTQQKRTIIVSIGASLERPSSTSDFLTKKNASNRVAYFPTRSKRPDLTSGADWGTGEKVYISFAVQDTGRGLDEDEKKLLFLRFSQASPRTHVQYGGSGLGLFISRELTELQGGEIGVASERGVGSTFAFYIKGRRTDPPTDVSTLQVPGEMLRKNSTVQKLLPGQSQSQSRAERKSAVTQTVSLDSGTLKVLIVEDNIVNSRVLNKNLKNLGCITYVANHGGEALEHLQRSRWWKDVGKEGIELSVILMDLEMPVMDGLTCARRIRELQGEGVIRGHVPIIAVTANARDEQIQTALQAGMVCLLHLLPPQNFDLMEFFG
jgi:PAS domain S-box-containing protein